MSPILFAVIILTEFIMLFVTYFYWLSVPEAGYPILDLVCALCMIVETLMIIETLMIGSLIK